MMKPIFPIPAWYSRRWDSCFSWIQPLVNSATAAQKLDFQQDSGVIKRDGTAHLLILTAIS